MAFVIQVCNHRNNRPFVSTVMVALVGILMRIGNVNDTFPLIKLLQTREAPSSHSLYCRENRHEGTTNILSRQTIFLQEKYITQQYHEGLMKSHRTKTIAK